MIQYIFGAALQSINAISRPITAVGIMLVAAYLLVTTGSQNAIVSASVEETGSGAAGTPGGGDILIEEAAEAGNATMTAPENETAEGNMTGTNSTG